jgi:hypothetical protein
MDYRGIQIHDVESPRNFSRYMQNTLNLGTMWALMLAQILGTILSRSPSHNLH